MSNDTMRVYPRVVRCPGECPALIGIDENLRCEFDENLKCCGGLGGFPPGCPLNEVL